MLPPQETQSIHDSMNRPKIEFIVYIYIVFMYYKYLKYKNSIYNLGKSCFVFNT